MSWQYTLYILPLLITVGLAFYVVTFVAKHQNAPGGRSLMVLALAAAVWSAGYALELVATELATELFWAKVQYVGIVSVAPAWFVFATEFTGRKWWLTHYRRNLILLAVVPFLTLLLVWTNEFHSLIWSETDLRVSRPFVMLDLKYGLWFWVHVTYSYLLLLLGSIWLAAMLLRSTRLYRWQAALVWSGMVTPWIANGLYLAGAGPIPGLDLTPFAFTLAGLAYAWGLFGFHLLEIGPVARQTVIDGLEACIFVLDTQGRIVDLNPAARRLAKPATSRIIGRPAHEILGNDIGLDQEDGPPQDLHREITLGEGRTARYFDLQISALTNPLNQHLGRLLVLHDVTDRKRTEKILREQNEYLAALHETTLGLIEQLDQNSLLETILTKAASLAGTAHGYLYVIEPGETEMVLKIGTGIFADRVGFKLKRGQGLSGSVWDRGQTLSLDDYSGWSNRVSEIGDGVQAAVGIPLRAGTELSGVIGLAYLEQGQVFTANQIDLLRRFGQLASLTLENARLYAAAQSELTIRKQAEVKLKQAKDELETKVAERTSDLKQANEQLRYELGERRRAEERYRMLFEEAPVMYVITRNEGGQPIIFDCNRLFLTTLGYSWADVLARPLADFYTPQSRRELLSGGYQEALAGDFLSGRERHLVTRQGEIIKTLLQAVPEKDAEGNVFGTRAMFVDISPRIEMEEALRQSEAKYRSLVENSRDGIVLVDEDGTIVEWNQGQEEITGLRQAEVLGHSIWDVQLKIAAPDRQNATNREQLKGMISNFLRTGQGLPLDSPLEQTIQRIDGQQKTIETRIFAIKSDRGVKVGSISRDVSDRKQAEQQLLRQANILQNIFDAMIVTDLEFRIESWNTAAEFMYGWQVEEVLGKAVLEVLQMEYAPDQREDLIRDLFERGHWRGETIQHRKDGTPLNILASVSIIKNSSGEPLGAVTINRDITDRKQAEEVLKRHQEQLEGLVEARTAELSAANAELGRALRAREQFVANMSHELRTPLSLITFLSGNLDTLYDRLKDTRRRYMIRDIRKHTQVLNELIGNVLEVSRLDSSSLLPDFKPLNLAQLVREEVDRQLSLARQKSQTLKVTGAEHMPVSGDEIQLRQVIRNLLSNAIKYTPDHQRITWECLPLLHPLPAGRETEWPGSPGLPGGCWAAVRVVDTGPGINPEDQPRLFERFYRVKNQGNIPGTGLGLAIARELIELHGGQIALASRPDEGSIFAFYLPLAEEPSRT